LAVSKKQQYRDVLHMSKGRGVNKGGRQGGGSGEAMVKTGRIKAENGGIELTLAELLR